MLTKKQKQEIVDDLAEKLSRQKGTALFDFTGLKVNQLQELRKKLRTSGIDCRAAKKTVIDLALDKAGLKELKAGDLPGQLAIALGYEDETAAAKIVYDFSKKNDKVKLLAGFAVKDYLDESGILALAKLPSKTELLAKLVWSVKAPIYGLHNVLEGNLVKLLYILKGLKQEA